MTLMQATRPYVISFESNDLVDFSRTIYQSFNLHKDRLLNFFSQPLNRHEKEKKILAQFFNNESFVSIESIHFVLTKEKTDQLQSLIPFLSGSGYGFAYPPNGINIPHVDGLSSSKNLFGYNLIVPIDNAEHTITNYYSSELITKDCPELHTRYLPDFAVLDQGKEIFSCTITKPTLFYHQHLHDAKNYGNTTRTAIVWKFKSNTNLEEITTYLTNCNKQLEYIYNH